MAVLLEQLLTEYKDASGQMRQTLKEVITPTQAGSPTYPRAFYHPRTPIVITNRAWLQIGETIECFCNPSNAGWSVPRRESLQKTASGQVLNSWKNRYRNTYFDAMPVAFSFQSGSILPSAAYDPAMVGVDQMVADSSAPVIPAGLDNFYKFLSLLDQPRLGGSQANYHIMVYHSRVFPELWLEGWFQPEGVTWRDEGNSVNWEATMVVMRTVPHLSNYDLVMGLYQDWVKANAISEMVSAQALEKIQQNKMAAAFAEGIPQATKPDQGPAPAADYSYDPAPGQSTTDLLYKAAGMTPPAKTGPSKVGSVQDTQQRGFFDEVVGEVTQQSR